MSNINSNFQDIKTTVDKLESLLTVLHGLVNYHELDHVFEFLLSSLEHETGNLSLILGLVEHNVDFAFDVGLLRGLPLDAKHKQPEELS